MERFCETWSSNVQWCDKFKLVFKSNWSKLLVESTTLNSQYKVFSYETTQWSTLKWQLSSRNNYTCIKTKVQISRNRPTINNFKRQQSCSINGYCLWLKIIIRVAVSIATVTSSSSRRQRAVTCDRWESGFIETQCRNILADSGTCVMSEQLKFRHGSNQGWGSTRSVWSTDPFQSSVHPASFALININLH